MTAASVHLPHDENAATVTVRFRPGVAIVYLAGELDIVTVPMLRSALADVELVDLDVWIDMSGVAFMDASALGALVESYGRAPGRGRTIRIVSAPPWVARLLNIAQLDDLLGPAARA